MKLTNRILFFIISQLIISITFPVIFTFDLISKPYSYLLFILPAAFLFYLFYRIFLPLRTLNKVLDQCLDEQTDAEKLLESQKKLMPLIQRIIKVTEVCASEASRDNFAAIYDKQAELTALQRQINPHFLYNTLDTIRGQAMIDDNREIAKMVEALADFFRYGISRKGELVTLREEIANVKNYMAIQQYRFNNRFSLEIEIDKEDQIAYEFLVPRLIIQPVIENAIQHGLKDILENCIVTIEISLTEKNLIITVSDNGKGIDSNTLSIINNRINSERKLPDGNEQDQRGTGIALPNINKRIKLLFGDQYGVNVYSTLEFGTDVEFILPVNYRRDISP